jgi:hypothetical protein
MGDPNFSRIFTPDVDSFPAAVTTTTLSVEDLVKCCIEAKLFPLVDSTGITDQQSGSLAMAVQPWASTEVTADQDLDTTEDLQLPLGIETLRAGIAELNDLGSDRDIASFDPASNIQTAWNPAEFDARYEDGGVWDSFNLSDEMISGVLTGQDVDFASFVNAEHIA